MKKSQKDILAGLLRDLTKQVQAIDDQEFGNILAGTARIELRVISKRKDKGRLKKVSLTESKMLEIRNALEKLETREEGAKLLKEKCKIKEDLIRLSKYIDLPVQKSDKVEQLSERIIEATIGYRARSAAIQGLRKDDLPVRTEKGRNWEVDDDGKDIIR